MQKSLLNIFVRLSQKALDKSRAYYYPLSASPEAEGAALNDIAFAAMLREIDAFSAQLRAVPAPSEDARYRQEPTSERYPYAEFTWPNL